MTHDSGVLIAYYARGRGFSGDGLAHYAKLQEKVSNLSSQAVIHLKCVTGEDLFKHTLTLAQTHRQGGRDGEWDSDHVCVRLRGPS